MSLRSLRVAALALLAAAGASACMLFDVKEQEALLDARCAISGTVSIAKPEPRPLVIVLLRHAPGAAGRARGDWQVADHFVLEQPGRWGFGTGPGRYALSAYEDVNDDRKYQPGEPYADFGLETPIACTPGAVIDGLTLPIPERVTNPYPNAFDVRELQKRSIVEHAERTLGQLMVVGEVVKLSDDRFSHDNAESGLWRPFDFLLNSWSGVYFLEPYDPLRVPVLFVHGANGTPLSFSTLIEKLDRTRFQAWVAYYPSGMSLAVIADNLNQSMTKLHARHRYPDFAVVAHSMGGLVARGLIQRQVATTRDVEMPLFVSISTPWGGHKAAGRALDSPIVVRVWRDMAPQSDYQRDLFSRPLPQGMRHHLIFTYGLGARDLDESSDGAVTVHSQLISAAQRDALRLHGFDASHVGVLEDPEVSALLNDILKQTFP